MAKNSEKPSAGVAANLSSDQVTYSTYRYYSERTLRAVEWRMRNYST
jgi:hypothetical protein